jgi:hypothetical protein
MVGSVFSLGRKAYGAIENTFSKGKDAYGKSKEVLSDGYGVYRTLTFPVRLPYIAARWGLGKSWDGIKWTWGAGTYAARTGKEVVLGAGVDAIGKSAVDLAMAPVDFVKTNLIDNTRTVIGGVFRLPGAILGTPGRAIKSTGEAIKETWSETRDAVSNLLHLHPIACAKNIRNAVLNTLKAPFSIAKATASPFMEMPMELAGNVKRSIMAYPNRLMNVSHNVRNGVRRVLDAPSTARNF